MLDALHEISVLHAGKQFLFRKIAFFDISGRHSDDRFETTIDRAGIPREFFFKISSRFAVVQSARQNAVFDEIIFAGMRTLVVIRAIAAPLFLAAVDD